MGNSSSSSSPTEKSNKEFLKDLKQNLEVEQSLRDPRFGNIKICRHKNNAKLRVFLLTKTPSEDEYERLTQEIAERQINHPNLLTIYGFDSESSGVCGSSGKATIFVEWHKHNLEKELDRRAEKAHFLSEQEVWYLLDALVSALIALENKRVFHGDLEPINVFITEEGYVKLCDHGLISELKTGYNRAVLGGEVALLSPELLSFYKEKDMRPLYDEKKGDVFSVGMTILHAATLKNSKTLYDMKNGSINANDAGLRLGEAERRYSQFLVGVIKKMLVEDPGRRPGLKEIHDILVPFQNNIRSLEGFDPRATSIPLPVNLQDNVNQYPFRPQYDSAFPGQILPRVEAPLSPTRKVQVHVQNSGPQFQSPRSLSPPKNLNSPVMPVQGPIYLSSQVIQPQPQLYTKVASPVGQRAMNQNLVAQNMASQSLGNQSLGSHNFSNQKILNQNMVVTQNMVSQNMVSQNMVSQNMVSQNMVNQNMVNQNIINQAASSHNAILVNENLPFSPSRNPSTVNVNMPMPLVTEGPKLDGLFGIQHSALLTHQQQVLPEITVPSQTLYSAPTPLKAEYNPMPVSMEGASYHVIYNSPQRISSASKFEEQQIKLSDLSPVNPNPFNQHERSANRSEANSSEKVLIIGSANRNIRDNASNSSAVNMSLDERIELALRSSEKMLKKHQEISNVSVRKFLL